MLTSFPNPMGASTQTVQVGKLAADFIAVLKESVRKLQQEVVVLRALPESDERTRRAEQVAADLLFLRGMVDASCKSLTSTWSEITIALHP